MGCKKLNTDFFNFLEIVHSKKSASEEKKRINYYPFGLKHKGYNNVVSANSNSVASRFGFGGKELNDELGLDWYDVSARNYDPALGRWMNLDPLAEQMRRHSPYNFAFNNPIYFQDYDGMAPTGSNCDDCPNSITYSYQKNSDTQDTHTVASVETTTNDSLSKDGNTKTSTSYAVTTTDITVRDKNDGTSTSTSQSVDKTTQTYSKDSEGNWVSNGDSSTSNIASNANGLVHENSSGNGVKTMQNGIVDGDNYVGTSRSSTNEVVNDRVSSFLSESNVGENLIDNRTAFEKVRTGSGVVSTAIGVGALIYEAGKKSAKWAGRLGRAATVVGGLTLGVDAYQAATKKPITSKVLKRY